MVQPLFRRALLLAWMMTTVSLLSCEVEESDYQALPWTSVDVKPEAIVGGTETNYGAWQAAVGLWYDQGGGYGNVCTATLIDPAVVITAAHCVYLPFEGIDAVSDPSRIDIVGGADLMSIGRVFYSKPQSIVTHPTWRGELVWGSTDLAIIQLASPITGYQPYGVRDATDLVEVGETGKIVGYGMAGTNQTLTAGVHRVGDTTVLGLQQGGLMELGDPSGTCQGDSGGPFFTKRGGQWVLTGVTSFGTTTTCLSTRDSWDVNVLEYRNWIDGVLVDMVGHGLMPVGIGGEGEGEGEGDGWGDSDSDGDPQHPFGLNSKNPVDCACRATGRARSMSGLEWLLLAL